MKKQNASARTTNQIPQFSPADEPVDIRYDAIFKAVFTRESREAKTALSKLVSAMLGQEVSKLRIVENEPAIEGVEDRHIRFDINCHTKTGERINVEMSFNPALFEPDRLEYHMGRLFTSQGIKGKNKSYGSLKKAYQITILAKHRFFPDNEFFHCFEYYDKSKNITLGGKTQIITVELMKLDRIVKKPIIELSARERWSLFFEYLTDVKYRDKINEIIRNDEGIFMATRSLVRITRSDREWAYNESRLKYELELQTIRVNARRARQEAVAKSKIEGRAEGLDEGRTEGLAEGRVNAKIEIARNMKAKGRLLAQIAEDTGLSPEEIAGLSD
jgi:predicted transposase/invertase (TIGR01784 family)